MTAPNSNETPITLDQVFTVVGRLAVENDILKQMAAQMQQRIAQLEKTVEQLSKRHQNGSSRSD